MCDGHIGICPHTPGGDPIEPADAPAAQSQSDALAKHILNGLGFCGHFLHFHGGGASEGAHRLPARQAAKRRDVTAGTGLAL